LRARRVDERRDVGQRRATSAGKLDVAWQHDREPVVRDRYRATALAVHDRDRRSPVTLARYEPVAQAIRDRWAADAALFRLLRDGLFAVLTLHAAARSAPDHAPLPDVGRVQAVVLLAIRGDHFPDLEAIFLGEREVALVVAGDGHDRARSVRREDVVRHPDRYAFAGEDVAGERAGVDPCLLALRRGALDLGHVARRLDVALDLGLLCRRGDLRDERVLGRQDHECRAVDRVGTRGEKPYRVAHVALDRERELNPFRGADPARLEHAHALGPIEALELQQLVRVLRDLVEPLAHLTSHGARFSPLDPARY